MLLTAEQFKCTILAHSISLEVQRTIHSETELQRHRIPLKEKFTDVAAPSLLPCLPLLPSPVGGERFSLNASVEGIPDRISSASPRGARSPRFELRTWVIPSAAPPPADGLPRRPPGCLEAKLSSASSSSGWRAWHSAAPADFTLGGIKIFSSFFAANQVPLS